jgi:hypothetical protein
MADEILWNVAICASTYAELGEAWVSLRMTNSQLDEPDGGRVLYESGAAPMYQAAHELVEQSMRGLDLFLNIQGNYLEGIRKGVHVDLSELEAKAQKAQEEAFFKIRKTPASIIARGKANLAAQPGLTTETYPGGEIYPGLYAYETPPAWLGDWVQFVSYGGTGSPAKSTATPSPWPDRVQYTGA